RWRPTPRTVRDASATDGCPNETGGGPARPGVGAVWGRIRASVTNRQVGRTERHRSSPRIGRRGLSESPRSPADAGPSRKGLSESPRSPADAGPSREGLSESPRSPADAGPSREGIPPIATERRRRISLTQTREVPDPVRLARYARAPEIGPTVLFFSGGTALRKTSRVLTEFTHNSVHLITPFDSGGSSAKLRDAFP